MADLPGPKPARYWRDGDFDKLRQALVALPPTIVTPGAFGTLTDGTVIPFCADLNAAPAGWSWWADTSTARPTSYGLLFTFSKYGTTTTPASDVWLFQQAFGTDGITWERCNINGGGWSSWTLTATMDSNGDLAVNRDVVAVRHIGAGGDVVATGAVRGGSVVAPSLDRSDAGTLALGAGNATDVQIGKVSVPAKVYGKVTGAQSTLETVAARYRHTLAGVTIANGATLQVNFDTKDFDTHNAVTTGVGTWKFTAPAAGLYLFTGCLGFTFGSSPSGSYIAAVYVNGSERSRTIQTNVNTNLTHGTPITDLVSLAANDAVDIRWTNSTLGVTATLNPTSAVTHLSILRIAGS